MAAEQRYNKIIIEKIHWDHQDSIAEHLIFAAKRKFAVGKDTIKNQWWLHRMDTRSWKEQMKIDSKMIQKVTISERNKARKVIMDFAASLVALAHYCRRREITYWKCHRNVHRNRKNWRTTVDRSYCSRSVKMWNRIKSLKCSAISPFLKLAFDEVFFLLLSPF